MEIKPYINSSGKPYLPTRCWYSRNAGNKPLEMEEVKGICLHKISGKIAFPDDMYNKGRIVKEIFEKLRVGYNIWIDQDGDAELLVPLGMQAFHAGKSRYRGKNYCNKFLIGIGLISNGHVFSDSMIDTLAEITLYLMDKYGFDNQSITTHQYVRNSWNSKYPKSQDDSRMGDPGDFPWEKYRDLISPPADLDGG